MTWAVRANSGKVLMCALSCFSNDWVTSAWTFKLERHLLHTSCKNLAHLDPSLQIYENPEDLERAFSKYLPFWRTEQGIPKGQGSSDTCMELLQQDWVFQIYHSVTGTEIVSRKHCHHYLWKEMQSQDTESAEKKRRERKMGALAGDSWAICRETAICACGHTEYCSAWGMVKTMSQVSCLEEKAQGIHLRCAFPISQ